MKLQISWDDTTLESDLVWKDLRDGKAAELIGTIVFDFEVKNEMTIDIGGDDDVFELDVADHGYDDEDELSDVLETLLDELEKKLTAAGFGT